ncbi:glycosyltransferase [Tropicimonas sp. IMCC6043]|uniref:glycosyltransferase n=1 Tax=Tropicimonas sp. IMCC6043 TaxID=2510645 RepID=UPI0013E9BD7C|nr:glycosyltransferase [Tropicimonas sp. IMCC6043]
MSEHKLKVTVLDMQPIDPPVGGGRMRLFGLYHALGADIETTYVGTYDWPGEKPRDQMMSETLREVMVPLSDAHFAKAEAVKQSAGGKTVIDSAFHSHVHLSGDYLERTRAAVREADAVVYSHPWLHPPTADLVDRSRQVLVYDSQNVEGKLRMALLDDGGTGTEIVREVVRIERALCRTADMVLACSSEDAAAFTRLYGVNPERLRIVPNGTFTEQGAPRTPESTAAAKAKLGAAGRALGIFLGSAYDPNVEAARFLVDEVAPRAPEITFVIAGGVGQVLDEPSRENVIVTGPLSEEDKQSWLAAADVALNPMFSGSGTNIKMLDFMAAGLPVVTTPTGARGLMGAADAFRIADRAGFISAVNDLVAYPEQRETLASAAVRQVKRRYSWERISPHLGTMMRRRHKRLGNVPRVSVVIPTYERHASLTELIGCLALQDMQDFEVIVVDQSAASWPDADKDFGIDLCYVHTDVKGAVSARNSGVDIANGRIIAFTDDDCRPPPTWLSAAVMQFDAEPIVGIEGLIKSEKHGDPDWRPVTNDDFTGIGFMTANLFVRADVFRAIGGFDTTLEDPHFREDTDLGWRMQELGPVPFSKLAWTFHPAHCRSVERESLDERSRFFVNDAKLMTKHPDRYVELFLAEKQWISNPYFLRYFYEGLQAIRGEMPGRLVREMKALGLRLPDCVESQRLE